MDATGQPRRRLNAVLLSVLVPGLGELYAGRPRRAALTFALYQIIALVLGIGAVLAPLHGAAMVLPLLLLLAAWVLVLTRAASAAVRAPQPYPLQPYNRWYWYLAAVLISFFVWRPTLTKVVRTRWVEAFRNPSHAMEPTLLVGDFFFVSTRPSTRRPSINEIVVISSPTDRALSVVKRVVGMPSDTLSMRNGVLTRNGVGQVEPFAQLSDSIAAVGLLTEGREWQVRHLVGERVAARTYHPDMRNWGPLVVPVDSVFVLGDNRDESYDSRFYGAVAMNRIKGRALVIYFSVASPFAIRWGRIGLRF